MKKILVFLILFSGIVSYAQERKVIVLKKSETLTKHTDTIVVDDAIFNPHYTEDQSKQAIVQGKYEISSKRVVSYNNFTRTDEQHQEFLVYTPGMQVYRDPVITKNKPDTFALTEILVTFLYFFIFIFLFEKYKKEDVDVAVVAVGAAAAAVVVAFAVAVAVGAAAVVAVAFAVAVAVGVAVGVGVGVATAATVASNDIKKTYKTFSILSLLGMAVIWYFFTPLFFVATLAGIICGYFLARLTKKKKQKI